MKKFLKVFLFIICLCPIVLLAACQSPSSYLITAKPSDSILGSVQGALTEQQTEGTGITLTAKENSPQTNPFICWVKDYKKVVSTEKSLNITYNSYTAGFYTAIFAEKEYKNMRYACLSNILFDGNEYSSVNYEISTALMAAGSNEYSEFTNGELTVGTEIKTDCTSVLYLGGGGVNNEYKFNIKLNLTPITETETTIKEYTFSINELLKPEKFNGTDKCVITHEIPALNSSISLVFTKLSSTTFNN